MLELQIHIHCFPPAHAPVDTPQSTLPALIIHGGCRFGSGPGCW